MSENEFVERVARAICDYCASDKVIDACASWDEFSEIERNEWREEARAAITSYKAALAEAGYVIVPREPTPAMVEAGHSGWIEDENDYGDLLALGVDPEGAWRAMIDAALNEDKK